MHVMLLVHIVHKHKIIGSTDFVSFVRIEKADTNIMLIVVHCITGPQPFSFSCLSSILPARCTGLYWMFNAKHIFYLARIIFDDHYFCFKIKFSEKCKRYFFFRTFIFQLRRISFYLFAVGFTKQNRSEYRNWVDTKDYYCVVIFCRSSVHKCFACENHEK